VREFFFPFFFSSSVFLFSTRFRKRKKNSDIF